MMTGAPWWAYAILIYLLSIGFKAIKPQIIGLPKLFILPIIITRLLAKNLFNHYNCRFDNLTIFILSLGIGGIISCLLFKSTNLKIDRANKTITLPGGYGTLILLLSIFIIRYFWGYMETTHSSPLAPHLVYFKILSSGIIAGLSIGRSATYLYKFFKSK